MQISTKENPIYYVYMSYEQWGLSYIGYRKCPPGLTPETDTKYFGSYRHQTYNPTEKIILATFDNDDDALALEIILHKLYKVGDNKKFANLAEQRSKSMKAPHSLSDSTRKKLSELNSGENNPNYGRKGEDHWHYGKKLPESHKQKISKGLLGRKLSQDSIDMIKKSNILTKEKAAKKYDWINQETGELELNKSIMYMSRTYEEDERRLRRCAKGQTKCKNTAWKTKTETSN